MDGQPRINKEPDRPDVACASTSSLESVLAVEEDYVEVWGGWRSAWVQCPLLSQQILKSHLKLGTD